jgi:hypothetical protein
MRIRKRIRDSAFELSRRDLAAFLADHEEDLLAIFREEMQVLDDSIPEEDLFIDIKMVPLGETILKASLHAITRFLMGDTAKVQVPIEDTSKGKRLDLKDSAS